MSNYVPALGSLILPDPNKVASGVRLQDPTPTYIAETYNHVMNSLRASPVVTQNWIFGHLAYEVVGGALTACCKPWRIPRLSDSHNAMTAYVLASCHATGGKISLTSAGSTDVGSATMTALVETWYTINFDSATLAGDYDEITMSITANTGQEITIRSITIEYDTLVAPGANLPASAVDGASPLGTASFGSDDPLTAYMGELLLDGLESFTDRPRLLFQWSGVSAAVATYTGGGSDDESLAHYPHLSWNLRDLGVGESAVVYAYVRPDALAITEVNVAGWKITVPAGGGDQWIQASVPTVFREAHVIENYGSQSFAVLGSSMQMSAANSSTRFSSSATILSLVAWSI